MKVAVDYNNMDGYINYDEVAKTIEVFLPDEAKRREVEDYLKQAHTLLVPGADCKAPFVSRSVVARESLDDFYSALSRLWERTDVAIQWSRRVN